MSYANRFREERARIWEQMKANLDRAAEEKRDLTAEEESAFQAANADLDRLDERIKQVEAAESRAAAYESAMTEVATTPRTREADKPSERTLEQQFRALLTGEIRELEVRADTPINATLGTDTDGSDLVPTTFYGRLVDYMRLHSGVLACGPTILNTNGGEPMDIPIVTGVPTSSATDEAAVFTESEPAFSKRAMGAFKYGHLSYITREMVSDGGVDILGFLSRVSGEALGDKFGYDLLLGAGTTAPYGVLTQASTGVTGSAGVAGVPTFDNVIDLYYSVIAPYRTNAKWLMDDTTAGVLRKLKDSTNQYLWQPSLTAGTPDTILGKPVFTDPNMPNVAAGAKSILFGDFSAYWVRQVGGVRFERSDEVKFTSDVITYKAVIRGDGVTVDQSGALKVYVGGSAS